MKQELPVRKRLFQEFHEATQPQVLAERHSHVLTPTFFLYILLLSTFLLLCFLSESLCITPLISMPAHRTDRHHTGCHSSIFVSRGLNKMACYDFSFHSCCYHHVHMIVHFRREMTQVQMKIWQSYIGCSSFALVRLSLPPLSLSLTHTQTRAVTGYSPLT